MKTAAFTAFALAILTTAALAETVTIAGCPKRGVEAGCLMLYSAGTTYNITSANPKPDLTQKLGISLTGEIDSGGVSICNQGTLLKNIKWSETKMKCD